MIRTIFILFFCAQFNMVVSAQTLQKNRQFVENKIKLSTGVSLDYVTQGDEAGMPVIFLHGYTDSWHSYETVLSYLPHNLNVFAISQRGHGNSSKPLFGYNPHDFAEDIAAFIKEMKLGSVVIVGHSMGGIIAQQFALDFPQLIKALVIVDSNASFKDNQDLKDFFNEVSRLMDPVSYQFAEGFQKSTIEKPIDSGYLKVLVGETLKLPARVWIDVLKGFMQVDFTNELWKISVPVLIVWGDKDVICSRASQDVLLHNIPDARLLVYEGIGHALHWEEPRRFADDLVDFIYRINK